MEKKENRNRQVYLNFGMIAYGPLEEIEALQKLIENECKKVKVVYQTVTARRLKLSKLDVQNKSG